MPEGKTLILERTTNPYVCNPIIFMSTKLMYAKHSNYWHGKCSWHAEFKFWPSSLCSFCTNAFVKGKNQSLLPQAIVGYTVTSSLGWQPIQNKLGMGLTPLPQ